MDKIRATTIVAVKKENKVAIAGDGQVTFGETVFKAKAKKIRKIKDKDGKMVAIVNYNPDEE